MLVVFNTPEPPPEVAEEFERQLDDWAVEFRKALARHFAERDADKE